MLSPNLRSKLYRENSATLANIATNVYDHLNVDAPLLPLPNYTIEEYSELLPVAASAVCALEEVIGMLGGEEWLIVEEETGSTRFHCRSVVQKAIIAKSVISELLDGAPETAENNGAIGTAVVGSYLSELDIEIQGATFGSYLVEVDRILKVDTRSLSEAVSIYRDMVVVEAASIKPTGSFTSE